jgi:hypothetical protein
MLNTVVVIITIIDKVLGIVAVLWDGRRRNFGLISGSVEGYSCTHKRPSDSQVHPDSYATGGATYKGTCACIWLFISASGKVKNEWRCKPSPLQVV